mmetsp:Transcript_30560/g.88776  ORF Transcript_30560/g.88776 Transcript_30560/m.88776 type:complete len:210 (-) Transcript_30560:1372-2001(-)
MVVPVLLPALQTETSCCPEPAATASWSSSPPRRCPLPLPWPWPRPRGQVAKAKAKASAARARRPRKSHVRTPSPKNSAPNGTCPILNLNQKPPPPGLFFERRKAGRRRAGPPVRRVIGTGAGRLRLCILAVTTGRVQVSPVQGPATTTPMPAVTHQRRPSCHCHCRSLVFGICFWYQRPLSSEVPMYRSRDGPPRPCTPARPGLWGLRV